VRSGCPAIEIEVFMAAEAAILLTDSSMLVDLSIESGEMG
jgi:hypothetical protein